MIALALLAGCSGSSTPPVVEKPPEPITPRKNAVVIVVDTMRVSAIAEAATPAIQGLAASGDQAKVAWAAGTWTVPSVIAMMTGMPVRQHGWDLPAARLGKYPSLPDAPTVASVLHDAGFATTGFYANTYLAEKLGFDKGFDTWAQVPDAAMGKRVEKEVARWNDGKRHYLYVHLLGPHTPLKPSDAARDKYKLAPQFFDKPYGLEVGAAQRNQEEGVRDAYVGAYHAVLEDTDARIAEILKLLEPYKADTSIVLTSDHGELLGEHGSFGHGSAVWSQLTNVPFIAVNAGEIPDAISNAALPDVVTTSVGVAHEWPVKRSSGYPLVSQREGRLTLTTDGHTVGVWDQGKLQVFDVAVDPKQEAPIQGKDADLEAAKAAFEKAVAPGEARALVDADPNNAAKLEALGYVKGQDKDDDEKAPKPAADPKKKPANP